MKYSVTVWKLDGSKYYRYFEEAIKASTFENKIRKSVLAIYVKCIK